MNDRSRRGQEKINFQRTLSTDADLDESEDKDTDDFSQIRPDGIPIPLGLPILHENDRKNSFDNENRQKVQRMLRNYETKRSYPRKKSLDKETEPSPAVSHEVFQMQSVDEMQIESSKKNSDCFAWLKKEKKAQEDRSDTLTDLETFESLQKLFLIIQMGSDIEMENFLKRYCHPVEIVPKFGCKKKYHFKINQVNARDHFGNFPLLLSCKMGSSRNKMTSMLLKYGANPNQMDNNKDCPLVYVARSVSLKVKTAATNTDNENILRQLLHHGADIKQAVDTLCDTLEDPRKETRTAMMSLTALFQPEFLMLTKDPIETAHYVNYKLMKIKEIIVEYTTQCNNLIETGRKFTYDFLDDCQTHWEARRLLYGSNHIENALETKEKLFLSHPFCQEIILEEFYGSQDCKTYCKKILLILKGVNAAFWCCIHSLSLIVLVPKSYIPYAANEGEDPIPLRPWKYKYSPLFYCVRTLKTPFYSFLCDAFNLAILLVLLVYVACSVPQKFKAAKDKDNATSNEVDIFKRSTRMALPELLLWLSILSRILTEFYQILSLGFKKYLSNFWNYVDVVVCVLLTSGCGLRIYGIRAMPNNVDIENSTEEFKNTFTNAIYIYSITQVFVFFRVMNFLTVKRMFYDVFTLSVILVIIVMGFVCAIYSVAGCYRNVWIDFNSTSNSTEDMFEQFKTFSETLITVTWSLFDIFQYDGLLHSHVITYRIILVLVLVHSIIGTVIILNTLIAMLNNTYQQIQENVDMEWKFSRTELFSEYKEGIPWLFPFSLIVIPLCLACRAYSYAKRRTNVKKPKKHVSIRYGKWLDVESDNRDTKVNSGHIGAFESDGIVLEAASKKPDLEDPDLEDSVMHEIQMRYLLINMLQERHSQRKYCSNQSHCAGSD